MDDYEFAKNFDEELDSYLRKTASADFILNPPQALAFTTLVCRLQALAQEAGGTVEPIQLVPRLGCGGVTASLPLLDLYGDGLQRLCCVLRYASAVTVDALDDGSICISLTVPDVFIEN